MTATAPSSQIKSLVSQSVWAEPFTYDTFVANILTNGNLAFAFYAADNGGRQCFYGISEPAMTVPASFGLSFGGDIINPSMSLSPLNNGFFVLTSSPEPDSKVFAYQAFTPTGIILTPEYVVTVTDINYNWREYNFPAVQGDDRIIFVAATVAQALDTEYDGTFWRWTNAPLEPAITAYRVDDLEPTGNAINLQPFRTDFADGYNANMGAQIIGACNIPGIDESLVLYIAEIGANNASPSNPQAMQVQAFTKTGEAASNFYEFSLPGGVSGFLLPNFVSNTVCVITKNSVYSDPVAWIIEYSGVDLNVAPRTIPIPDLSAEISNQYTILEGRGKVCVNDDGTVWIAYRLFYDDQPLGEAYLFCRYSSEWELMEYRVPWRDGTNPTHVSSIGRSWFTYPRVSIPNAQLMRGPTAGEFSFAGPLLIAENTFSGFAQQLYGPIEGPRTYYAPQLTISLTCTPCADVMLDGVPSSFHTENN